MFIDEPTNQLLPCSCGATPNHYSIGYGRTPYSINCPGCQKSFHGGSGWAVAFFNLWNKYVRQLETPGVSYGIFYPRQYLPLIFKSELLGLIPVGKPINPVRDRDGRFAKLYHEEIF